MWVFFIIMVICFTAMVVFRMFLDLRRQELQHVRLLQNDARSYDKYTHVTRQEAIEQVSQIVERIVGEQAALPRPSQMSDRDLDMQKEVNRTARQLPIARYLDPGEPPMLNQEWVDYKTANDFERFMRLQRAQDEMDERKRIEQLKRRYMP
jgi:hypothetical protein